MSLTLASDPQPVAADFSADSRLVDAIVASPNHGERRAPYGAGRKPDILLLHYTGMPAGRGMTACERAVRWLTMTESQVSCHYVVDEDGRILQLVPEARRAWHAGLGAWRGNTDINSASIGIEIVNPGHFWDITKSPDATAGDTPAVHPGYCDFPAVQIDAVIRLCSDIVARNHMPSQAILAHSDIAPARKSDPGEKFPWARLAEAGLGLWVPPVPRDGTGGLQFGNEGQPIAAIQSMLGQLGFELAVTGVFDIATRNVVTAFQRHWRPELVDGIADRSTMATLHQLLMTVQKTASGGTMGIGQA